MRSCCALIYDELNPYWPSFLQSLGSMQMPGFETINILTSGAVIKFEEIVLGDLKVFRSAVLDRSLYSSSLRPFNPAP